LPDDRDAVPGEQVQVEVGARRLASVVARRAEMLTDPHQPLAAVAGPAQLGRAYRARRQAEPPGQQPDDGEVEIDQALPALVQQAFQLGQVLLEEGSTGVELPDRADMLTRPGSPAVDEDVLDAWLTEGVMAHRHGQPLRLARRRFDPVAVAPAVLIELHLV